MFRIGFRENRGFSMVELSMVLAVTAVAAAFAVPMLTEATRGMQLASDAKKISTTMSYAKLSATAQGTSYQLSFDLDNNQWSMLKRNSAGVFELEQAVNSLSDGVRNSGIAFKSESGTAPTGFPTSSSTSITFNARGLPSGIGIIYLSNEDADYAVSVSLAGKIQVWKLNNNEWIPS